LAQQKHVVNYCIISLKSGLPRKKILEEEEQQPELEKVEEQPLVASK
jgi:hypothetical protein